MAGYLSGRYSRSESNQRRVDKGQRFPYLVITQPGVVDKLEETSSRTRTNNRGLGCKSRFSRNECLPSLESDHITLQELASLVGSMNATVEAVIPALLNVRELQMFKTKHLIKEKSYKN